jgi:putative tricarboxylic transport membrane protein
VLIEGILLLAISLVSIAEGVRLITYKGSQTVVRDILGPSFYIFSLGIALMTTGIVHLFVNYKKDVSTEKVAINREMRIRMISMVVVLAVYTLLIDIVGYLVATIIFFFLEFRIVGIKSWIVNIILTLIITAAYYIVFVKYCEMIFPQGILFR